MRKIFSLTALALSLFFIACKKDKSSTGVPGTTQKKLKQTTFDENWNFSYNNDGSLKEMNIGGTDYKRVFMYTPGTTEIQNISNGKMSSKAIYTISNGKPVKLDRTKYNAMGQPTTNYQEIFEYNAKGLLQKWTYANNNYEVYEYDSDDNLIRVTYYSSLGVAEVKTEYAYGNQKDLFPQYGFMNSNIDGFLFPPLSKYLPVSKIVIGLPGNEIEYHAMLSYELDADGYVIKGHALSQSPNYSDRHWTNTY